MTTISEMINARFAIDTARGTDMTPSETIESVLSRRAVRRYKDDDVSEGLLDVLLACAQSAPTKSNLQQYSIIVVRDAVLRLKLQEVCPKTYWLASSPTFLIFCADMRRNQRISGFRGYDHANNNLDTLINATVDAALVMQCFILAAESIHLGCAPISEVRNEIEAVTNILGLPKGVFPLSGLTVGWPADEGYVNQRLPTNVVVHKDIYDDEALESEIELYDQRRHDIFPITPNRQLHTDKYGIADVCTWSENVARQLSIPERSNLREYLKDRGFELA